jgi:orotidine-5'-phosphate decarboxylase
MSKADDRLIVALDFSSRQQAQDLIDKLGDSVSFYKIGYELFYGGDGLELGKALIKNGKEVFFDLKLLDIENTVEKAVKAIAKTGASFLTVHAYPKTMGAAARAASGTNLKVLGVTVLTSLDDEDIMNAGYDRDIASLVGLRAHQASLAKIGGVVCSAVEAAMVRTLIGDDMAVVTPGIRPSGAKMNDQKRAMSPSEALEQGATHLVIGRPITNAPDPKKAAFDIINEMQNGGTRLA